MTEDVYAIINGIAMYNNRRELHIDAVGDDIPDHQMNGYSILLSILMYAASMNVNVNTIIIWWL